MRDRMNQMPTDSRPLDDLECIQKVCPNRRSKRHLAYWEAAIFQRRPGGNWHMILQHAGQRRKLSLGTPIKAAAASKARDIYLAVASDGWDRAQAVLHGRPAQLALIRRLAGAVVS